MLGQGLKHIMISYEYGAQKEAKSLKQRLEKMGHEVWIDFEQKDVNTDTIMKLAIKEAYTFIPVLTEGYEENKKCRMELVYAKNEGKRIIPVVISMNYCPKDWIRYLLGNTYIYNCLKEAVNEQFEQKLLEILTIQHGGLPIVDHPLPYIFGKELKGQTQKHNKDEEHADEKVKSCSFEQVEEKYEDNSPDSTIMSNNDHLRKQDKAGVQEAVLDALAALGVDRKPSEWNLQEKRKNVLYNRAMAVERYVRDMLKNWERGFLLGTLLRDPKVKRLIQEEEANYLIEFSDFRAKAVGAEFKLRESEWMNYEKIWDKIKKSSIGKNIDCD